MLIHTRRLPGLCQFKCATYVGVTSEVKKKKRLQPLSNDDKKKQKEALLNNLPKTEPIGAPLVRVMRAISLSVSIALISILAFSSCLWGQDLISNKICLRNISGNLEPDAPPGTASVSLLVTFSLFAVVSILFWLLCHSSLLLMLPLLCVVSVGGGRVRPQSDDNTSHVVAAGPVSRCVGGQTVVQQLSREHVELQKNMPSDFKRRQMMEIWIQSICFDLTSMTCLTVRKLILWVTQNKFIVIIIIKRWRVSPLLLWMRVISHGHFH